jgi:hypothetical protein
MASAVTLYKFESAWNLPSFSHQCIQLEAYLRLFGVKFTEEKYTSANASPTGSFPALDIDGILLGGENKDGTEALSSEGGVVSGIIGKLKQSAGLDLDKGLSDEDSADLEAYVALAESHLQTATLWAMWCDDQSYSEWTRVSEAKQARLFYLCLCLLCSFFPPPLTKACPLGARYNRNSIRKFIHTL